MAKYRFKAKNNDNKVLRGRLIAKNPDELREILSHHGYYLYKYKKIAESSQMFDFLERLRVDDLSIFCRQFAFMVAAGIDIDEAIANIKNNTLNRKLRSTLDTVYSHLLEGNSLADSFALFPKTFPRFFINMIALGEASGNMVYVLKKLADYYETDAATKKKIKRATVYPRFLLIMIIGLLIGLSVYIMPMFTNLFNSFEADLPKITVMLNTVTSFIRINIGLILSILFITILIFYFFKQTKKGRYLTDWLSLKIPLVRSVIVNGMTVRFANGFAVLIDSGAKIIDSLEIIGRLLGNAVVEEKFSIVASEVRRGKSIARSIEVIDFFPNILIEMLRVGEESDSISDGLDKIAEYFENQVESSIKRLTAFIEPLFILIIGGLLLIVLLSVFGPMLGIMDTIGKM